MLWNHSGFPPEPVLRTAESYLDFLEARRDFLAGAANTFLDGLLTKSAPATAVPLTLEMSPSEVVFANGEDTLEAEILNLVETFGLVKPTAPAVVAEPTTGEEIGLPTRHGSMESRELTTKGLS